MQKVLDGKPAAKYIGMSESFLRKDRSEGPRKNHTPGPPFLKIGRRVVYLIDDLDEWLEKHRVVREAV